jgi:hypothetical protein
MRILHGFPQYSVYRLVLGLDIPIRLSHDLLKDRQLYITKPLDINTMRFSQQRSREHLVLE